MILNFQGNKLTCSLDITFSGSFQKWWYFFPDVDIHYSIIFSKEALNVSSSLTQMDTAIPTHTHVVMSVTWMAWLQFPMVMSLQLMDNVPFHVDDDTASHMDASIVIHKDDVVFIHLDDCGLCQHWYCSSLRWCGYNSFNCCSLKLTKQCVFHAHGLPSDNTNWCCHWQLKVFNFEHAPLML